MIDNKSMIIGDIISGNMVNQYQYNKSAMTNFLRTRRSHSQPNMPLPVEGNLCDGCYGTIPYDSLVTRRRRKILEI